MTLDQSQQDAVAFATTNHMAIINGGAGTGKTTLIKAINDALGGEGLVCAFAGKAAARLKQATGIDASTIHRMLKSDGESFRRETLAGETVIVDEASMVSADLLAAIVSRSPRRLILVGDQAQLPPVGAGQPFHDLITFMPSLVSTLTYCYRNSEAVYQAATTIRAGAMPPPRLVTDNELWQILPTGQPQATHDYVMELVRCGYIDFAQDIILCPKNGAEDQPCTVNGLNASIVDIANPRENPTETFRPGDRVMNTKNIASKDVWNGTTGTVHSLTTDNGVWVTLDIAIVDMDLSSAGNVVMKTEVLFDADEAQNLRLAYALTVHKAQGSQFRRVVFVCLERDSWGLLGRSLIYTAVTRATEQCTVIGTTRAFQQGLGTLRSKRTVMQELAKVCPTS